jgi:hypothetical protein
MIALLHLLQRLPAGGLLVAEEIESGLHAEAQAKLARVLVDICLEKNTQIICSTHSGAFLDALPREARLLLERSHTGHQTFVAPSTRFAVHAMSGVAQPEVTIYCEDRAAEELVSAALPHKLRVRTQVQAVGSDATVIRQGVAHHRGAMPSRPICVLDGDCTDATVRGWIRSENAYTPACTPEYLILPADGLPPERWVVRELQEEGYREEFARQFVCSGMDAALHIEALDAVADHHSVGHMLAKRTGLRSDDCLRRLMSAVAPRHPQLEPLRTAVAAALGVTPAA